MPAVGFASRQAAPTDIESDLRRERYVLVEDEKDGRRVSRLVMVFSAFMSFIVMAYTFNGWFWSFEILDFEFVSNLVLRISNLWFFRIFVSRCALIEQCLCHVLNYLK